MFVAVAQAMGGNASAVRLLPRGAQPRVHPSLTHPLSKADQAYQTDVVQTDA